MGFLLPTNIDIAMGWIGMKRRFRVEDDRIICASWEDGED